MLVLEKYGVRPGHVVAITVPQSSEYVELLLALWRMRAIAAPINPRFPEEYLQELLEQISAAWHMSPTLIHNLRPNAVLDMNTGDHPATVVFTSGSAGRPRAV